MSKNRLQSYHTRNFDVAIALDKRNELTKWDMKALVAYIEKVFRQRKDKRVKKKVQ